MTQYNVFFSPFFAWHNLMYKCKRFVEIWILDLWVVLYEKDNFIENFMSG